MHVTLINIDTKGGGMLHYCSQFANALAKKCTVSIILAQNIYDTYADYFDTSINIKTVPPPNKIFSLRTITEIPGFLHKLKATKPDIVHFTTYHPWISLFLMFIKHYKFFLTLHDATPHKGEDGFISKFSTFMFKRHSHHLFVHGESIKNKLLTDGIKENRITVIPHGTYSFLRKYKKGNCDSKEPIVLFFGRILDYKGIEYLLKAEPLITREIKNAKIIIAGEGDLTKYTKYIKNEKNIEFINRYIADEEVANLFQRARLVVLPYIEASQTGIIPIAYSFKRPVVVTNVGSLPECVEDGKTGYLIPPKDYGAIARAVTKLLKEARLCREMGENAYERMEQSMDWGKICDKVINSYGRV